MVFAFSFFTLSPKDPTEKKLFWEFRLNEIWNAFKIYTVIMTTSWLASGGIAVLDRRSTNLKNFAGLTVSVFLLFSIYLIGRCSKKTIAYLQPAYFLISSITIILVMEDMDSKNLTFDKHFQLLLEMIAILLQFFIHVILFSPTLIFTLFLYCPIYAITQFLYMNDRYDMSQTNEFSWNIFLIVIIILYALFFFLTLQMRELGRFS